MLNHVGITHTDDVQDATTPQTTTNASVETFHNHARSVSSQITHPDQFGPMSGYRCFAQAQDERPDGDVDIDADDPYINTNHFEQYTSVFPEAHTTSQPFRFLDLPAEIRIMIYKEMFTMNGRHMAVRDRLVRDSGPCTISASLVRHDQREWGIGIRQDSSILLVNRQISDEATFELYRSNTWCFERTLLMSRWLESISPEARKALRDVDLDYGSIAVRHEKKIAALLSESTYLRSLTIGPYTAFDRRRMARWAPLWRAIYARRGGLDDVVKCVRFRYTCKHCEERSSYGISCDHNFDERPFGDSEFRAELTRLLIDEPAKVARRQAAGGRRNAAGRKR